ncbi:hypothetical protein ISN44_As05g020100, partial [Arabidopsis suecica]
WEAIWEAITKGIFKISTEPTGLKSWIMYRTISKVERRAICLAMLYKPLSIQFERRGMEEGTKRNHIRGLLSQNGFINKFVFIFPPFEQEEIDGTTKRIKHGSLLEFKLLRSPNQAALLQAFFFLLF